MSEGHFVQDEYYHELLADFLDESQRLLELLNDNLLQLDELVQQHETLHRDDCDPDLINEMFRAAHSIKGLSAMLGLSEINTLTHKVENIFDAARRGDMTFTAEVVELLFESHDLLSGMIRKLQEPETEVAGPEVLLDRIEALLREALGEEAPPAGQSPAAAEASPTAEPVSPSPAQQRDRPTMQQPSPLAAEPSASLAPADRTREAPSVAKSPEQKHAPDEQPQDYFADVEDEAQVPDKYLAIFIDEADETLDQMTEALLGLEQGQLEAPKTLLVNTHRFKGSAASIGLHRASKLAHMMEEALEKLTHDHLQITPELIEAFFAGTDALRSYVEGLKQGRPSTESFNTVAHRLLEAVSGGSKPTEPPPGQSEEAGQESPKAASADGAALFAEHQVRMRAKIGEFDQGFMGWVSFDPQFPLKDLKAQLVVEKLHRLGKLLYCEPDLEKLESSEGFENLYFAVQAECDAESLRKQLHIVGVKQVVLEPFGTEEEGAEQESSAQAGSSPASASAAPPPEPHREKPAAKAPSAGDSSAGRSRGESARRPSETLRVDIDRLDQLMNLTGQLVITKARFSQLCEQIRQASRSGRAETMLQDVFESLRRIEQATGQESQLCQAAQESLRTHVRRIEANLQAVQQRLGQLSHLSFLANDLSEVAHQMDRISQGLQKTAMETRMVPIGPLFGRFRRIVRDITRLTGKDIRLQIQGEKTELDKRMIDELADPLIHLVRNAADHGIEPPEVRQAAGKPRWGTITLNAFHRGSSIVIQVKDDGRGLDADRILQKALEREVISPSEAEQLTPQQVYQLIWRPGFSTAEQVTEISGRGVGMDIVRSKVEAINGSVEVDSQPGQGTTFSIRLPLTLAILPSLLVRIHGEVFAIPLESVDEIVMAPAEQLSTVQGRLVADVRGRSVSVVYLDELFQWNEQHPARLTPPLTLVLLHCDGMELGLPVEHILGEEDVVIKSLADNFRNVPGIAGASILGDGRVGLILDVAAAVHGATRLSANKSSEGVKA